MKTIQAMATGAVVALTVGAMHARADETRRALNDLTGQFASLDAVSLGARVTVTVHEAIPGAGVPVGEPIEGFFEYAADGARWRRSSVLDASKFPGMNTTVAYDGSAYSYTMRDQKITSVSFAGPRRATGMSLPNPILELGRFCAPGDDLNTDLLLASVRAGARAGVTPVEIRPRDGGGATVRCAGDRIDGAQTMFDLTFDAPGRVVRVERRDAATGAAMSVIECDSHVERRGADGRVAQWPTRFTFLGMDPATGQAGVTIEMELVWLTTGTDAAGSVSFSPAWSEPGRIWIDELGLFIR
ncbi:MAG: hypothetical protein D6693_08585 [Planctomycetota bacterium]|nr:MAG: hypothetical protein D6693_08585 [Planctomycetota bacterium]